MLIVCRIPLQILLEVEVINNFSISNAINVVINDRDAKLATIIIILLSYFRNVDRIKSETILVSTRLMNEIFLMLAISTVYSEYFFDFNLISLSAIEITFIELLILIYKIGSQNSANQKAITSSPFACDVPSDEDLFNRRHYAAILLDKISETKNKVNPNKAFTIFLNERFGYGKTSFLLQLKKIIDVEKRNDFIYIDYNPWLCENEESMAKEFFTLLKNKLSLYDISLSRTFDSYIQDLGLVEVKWIRAFFSKNNNSIWANEKKISEYIRTIKVPVLVFVDDVDRLSKDEMLNLLKMLRNTADFGNVYYIIACDQQHIEQHLNCVGIQNPDKYIKKFANFEFILPSNDNTIQSVIEKDLKNFFENISLLDNEINKFIDALVKQSGFIRIFEDLRDWKRCLNHITFNIDVLRKENSLLEVYIPDVLFLGVLQHINVDVYKTLRDNDSVLLTVSQPDYTRLVLKSNLEEYCRNLNLRIDELEDNVKKEVNSISDFLSVETAGKEEHTSYILYRLFGDGQNWKGKLSICYVDSYFKYFSGKNRYSEIPMAVVRSLFCIESKAKFCDKLKEYELKYSQSLLHKIRYLSEQKIENKTERIDLFKKFIIYLEYRAEVYDNSRNIDQAIYKECNENVGFLFANLFLGESLKIGRAEWRTIREYLLKEVKISTIISLVKVIGLYDANNKFLSNRLKDLREIASSRYKKQYLDKNPFCTNSISLLLILADSRSESWIDTFSQFLRETKVIYPWLYLVVKPVGQSWVINDLLRNSLYSSVKPSFVKVLLERNDIEQPILEDFCDIVKPQPTRSFIEGDHLFLQKARLWWKANYYLLRHI